MKIGILGAGQLGRMLALAGYPLGFQFRFFDPTPESPASHLAEQVVGSYEDRDALAAFAAGCDVVTYEFENVPVEVAEFLADRVPVYPPAKALQGAQDRLTEKRILLGLGIPTPLFDAVDSKVELNETIERFGLPAVLKTRRMGYDGKGQFVLREPEDAAKAWAALQGSPLILEGFVPFEREVSLLGVRGKGGEAAFYPLVENQHREGILRLSLAPASGITPELQTEAEDHGRRLLQMLDYVGVLAIEFFVFNGRLIANEMAPRVHNSGHWTIEGAETSQFENHLRAIAGLPLGTTQARGFAAMVNIVGSPPDSDAVLALPGAHLHLYGKTPRPGRKIGHINLCAESEAARTALVAQVQALLPTP